MEAIGISGPSHLYWPASSCLSPVVGAMHFSTVMSYPGRFKDNTTDVFRHAGRSHFYPHLLFFNMSTGHVLSYYYSPRLYLFQQLQNMSILLSILHCELWSGGQGITGIYVVSSSQSPQPWSSFSLTRFGTCRSFGVLNCYIELKRYFLNLFWKKRF